jgi:hypothetical protein
MLCELFVTIKKEISSKMPQRIYCDESGSTGNNLSDDGTPFFVFSSVAVDEPVAANIVSGLKTGYRLQGELKGRNLTDSNRGRNALTEFWSMHSGLTHSIIVHKKFALACKLFEYIFEPVIASGSSGFYKVGFHKFVANLLYWEFQASSQSAGSLFCDFQRLMRGTDPSTLSPLFIQAQKRLGRRLPSHDVLEFALLNRTEVLRELDSLNGDGAAKWVLDLSSTCLKSVLVHWAETYDALDVICDDSKPLEAISHSFDPFIGQTEKISFAFQGEPKRINFNLSHSVQFGNSKHYAGVQLADLTASSLAYALQKRSQGESKQWLERAFSGECIGHNSVYPDESKLDPTTIDAVMNAALLKEILRRSRKGEDLLKNLDLFVLSKLTGRRLRKRT